MKFTADKKGEIVLTESQLFNLILIVLNMGENQLLSNKRIAKNTIALYLRMFVLMILSFFMSRVVLDVLGVVDYGIYNLVGSVVVSFSFLNISLSGAVQRFLNFEMGRHNYEELSKIFCTSINSFAGLSLIIAILAELTWFFYSFKLNIPDDRRPVAGIVFHIVILTTIVSMMQIPYNACIIAYEKMGFYAKISILEILLKFVLIFSITLISIDKLILYSCILLLNSIIILCVYILYCYKNFDISHYRFVHDTNVFKKITSFTSWSLFGNISGMLSESGVSMIFNVFSGVVINAAIGVAMQVNNAVVQLVGGFQTAFKPQLVKLYAAGDLKEFYTLIFRGSKFSFFLLFIFSLPIIVYPDILLDAWLVKVPQYAAQFCSIIFACSLVDAISGPFYFAIFASGKINKYQIAISASFLCHFVITYILLMIGLDYSFVFLSRLFIRGLVNFLIGLYFMRRLLKFPVRAYLVNVIKRCVLIMVIPLLFIFTIEALNICNNIISFILVYAITACLSIMSICLVGFDHNERILVNKYVKGRVQILFH